MDNRKEIVIELEKSMINFTKLVEILKGSDPSVLQTRVNVGDWNIIDVLRHIQHSEKGVVGQIKQILDGGKGFPENFDLNRYNESQVNKMSHLFLDDIVEKMSENRKNTLQLLTDLNEEDLDVRGNFANQKENSVKTFFKTLFHHQNNHINQIREVLNK